MLVRVEGKERKTMTQELQERPVIAMTEAEAEPDMVLFTDGEGFDLVDDVELISLSSATLGAIVARRC